MNSSVECVNFFDRALERTDHIAIGGPAKSDVTVADLNEAELSLSSGSRTAERLRARDAAADRPENVPRHAIYARKPQRSIFFGRLVGSMLPPAVRQRAALIPARWLL
jgi:hypothetical protein